MSFDIKTGVVKWFNKTKGFGFITDGSNDYFVHFKEIAMPGFKELQPDQKVTFTSRKTEKGLCAENVKVEG